VVDPLLEEGQPSALIGTSRLAFTPDGLVATGRDYWFLEPGAHPPYDGWATDSAEPGHVVQRDHLSLLQHPEPEHAAAP
jgi:hypothetical protein